MRHASSDNTVCDAVGSSIFYYDYLECFHIPFLRLTTAFLYQLLNIPLSRQPAAFQFSLLQFLNDQLFTFALLRLVFHSLLSRFPTALQFFFMTISDSSSLLVYYDYRQFFNLFFITITNSYLHFIYHDYRWLFIFPLLQLPSGLQFIFHDNYRQHFIFSLL